MAVRVGVESARKQADFVHLYVTGTIVVEALLLVIVRHTLGKANNYKRYSKVESGNCKHAWLSKQIGSVVCKASSVVCKGLSWGHICSVVCPMYIQLTGPARWKTKSMISCRRTQLNLLSVIWSYCGANFYFLWLSTIINFIINWTRLWNVSS